MILFNDINLKPFKSNVGRWGSPVSSTNKVDLHDIAEIFLPLKHIV
jgi:hypothetical protein